MDADQAYWFEQAAEINRYINDPVNEQPTQSGYFIQQVNKIAGKSDSQIKFMTNLIAEKVIKDIVENSAIPSLEQQVSADIAVALDEGGVSIAQWGGSFYYWDLVLPITDNKKLGQFIVDKSLDGKFIETTSSAMALTIEKFILKGNTEGSIPAILGAFKTFSSGSSDGLNPIAIIPALLGYTDLARELSEHSDQWIGLKVLFSTLQKLKIVGDIVDPIKGTVFDIEKATFDDFLLYLMDIKQLDENITIESAIEKMFNDYTYGTKGNDELDGGLIIGIGDDTLFGLAGNDKLYGGIGQDRLVGGDGNDELYGGLGDDKLYGGLDNDELHGGFGTDELYGGIGEDKLYGDNGDDKLFAGKDENDKDDKSKNYLYGGLGNDHIYGGAGNDTLVGNGGDDYIYGGDGNDTLYAGDEGSGVTDRGGENDELYGGEGDDTLIYNYSALFGGEGRLEGAAGFDTYKTNGTLTIMDEDGKGILYYKNKVLVGAEMRHQSDDLIPPDILDFSKDNYDINLKEVTEDRLVEIARTEEYVRYIVTGDINFKYKDLTTEELDTRTKNDTDLGIKFYVTVYKDLPPDPPPSAPPSKHPAPIVRFDPLILDLNHDGVINTLPVGSNVFFDLDGNGFSENTSWVQGTDGFVVLDINENGKIDNGAELFGTDTILPDGTKASDGFTALAQHDSNNDLIIDKNDQIFKKLKVWKDLNQDGVSQSNELFSLVDLNINSILLNKQNLNIIDHNNVLHAFKGGFTQNIIENGEIKIKNGLAEALLFDVNTAETKWSDINEGFESNKVDISDLPNLAGYGAVQSLHQVIELDTGGVLKELVENFVEASGDEKVLLTHEILYYWTTNKPSVSTNKLTKITNDAKRFF